MADPFNQQHCRSIIRMAEMKQRLKKYALIAAAGFLLWSLMNNHFIFEGRHVYLLKKTALDLHDTFVSLNNKKPELLIKNDRLREAGIGDLLVELGMLTDDEKSRLESKYNYGE
jgi:hypothetical protein